MPKVMEDTLQENIDVMKEIPDRLKIERLVGEREKQQTLTVRFILENHT